jgi:hypothetical protein
LSKKNGKGTLVQVVLDKSGSMESVQQATTSGYNEFVQEHRTKVPEARFSLTLFDTAFDLRHVNVPMRDVPDLDASTYRPSGWTALLDAVGASIRAVESIDHDFERVLFVIITDGAENSSKEYTREKIKDLVEWHQNEGKGWEFLFLGANIDSYAQAGMIGVQPAFVSNYNQTPVGTQTAFNTVAASSVGYSSGTRSSTAFTKAERKKVESTK